MPSPRLIAALLAGGLLTSVATQAQLPRSAAPPEARVYIQSPADGATVTSPVTVRFGLEGMGVAPAGVDKADTGHHHLLIDVTTTPPMDLPLPTTDQIRHFGNGQTEVELELEPGEHTLQLALGDYLHIPHDPPLLSEPITITVSDSAAQEQAPASD